MIIVTLGTTKFYCRLLGGQMPTHEVAVSDTTRSVGTCVVTTRLMLCNNSGGEKQSFTFSNILMSLWI
jgi:hypothetical protein